MSETLQIFGFGSFFAGAFRPKDIDLLVVHQSASRRSCELAISCKRLLLAALPKAHVVLLSEQEERGKRFIERSRATALGEVCADRLDEHVDAIAAAIRLR